MTHEISVAGADPFICKYVHSNYGTLFEKKNRTGKTSEYIAKWH